MVITLDSKTRRKNPRYDMFVRPKNRQIKSSGKNGNSSI